jgi:hypothetical protein
MGRGRLQGILGFVASVNTADLTVAAVLVVDSGVLLLPWNAALRVFKSIVPC